MHKLAVALFYACAILSLPVMVHAVARAGMAKAEFQDPYLKALGVTRLNAKVLAAFNSTVAFERSRVA